MMLRHVTTVTNLVEDPAEDHTMPAMGESWNEHEDQTDTMHIQADTSDKLFKWRAAEDTPEVFKRVRFLTQWYDAEDSRATAYYRLGQLKIWCTAGSAIAHRRQLVRMSVRSLQKDATLHFNNDAYTLVTFCFLGANRQDSLPMFLIYSKSKHKRERALRLAREIPWFRTSSIKIAACFGAIIRDTIIRQSGCNPDKI